MGENSGSKDRSFETLDFIINILNEHEKNLDELIDDLANVYEKIDKTDSLKGKIDSLEEKIDNLQKQVKDLAGYLPSASKQAMTLPPKEPNQLAQKAPALLKTVPQTGHSAIFCCKQWKDFQVLAMNAQMLAFSYKEDEKVFQVNAIKDNRMITYTGEVPDISIILKKWLSQQLDLVEQNIIEGSLAK